MSCRRRVREWRRKRAARRQSLRGTRSTWTSSERPALGDRRAMAAIVMEPHDGSQRAAGQKGGREPKALQMTATVGPALRGADDLLGDIGEFAAQPLMTLIPVVARVPHEPERKVHLRQGLSDPREPKLPLQDRRQRGGQRQKRIVVLDHEHADQRRGNMAVSYTHLTLPT